MDKLIKRSKEISIIAIIWNLIGVIAFFSQIFMSNENIQNLSKEQQELFLNESTLTTITFAIAVFSGLIGSVLLLIKHKLTTSVLALSVLVSVFQFLYNIFITKTIEVYGINTVIMPIIVIVVGIFLVLFSKKTLSNTIDNNA